MTNPDPVNILLVDDQHGKLLSYEAILSGLNENLVKASSGKEALEHLLKSEIAVILVDVCMPDLDGFQLAAMIRDHPRFQKTAIIFISAILLSEMDSLRGYEMGAVDYVPVPVVPEVLRAKVKVFAELYRKTRQLERLNQELEARVAARTAELEHSTAQLRQSEERRTLALAAGQMGSWEWDFETGHFVWDEGQYRIFGADLKSFSVTPENIRAIVHPDDWTTMQRAIDRLSEGSHVQQLEFRVRHPGGKVRWCLMSAAASVEEGGRVKKISGVTLDITERKEAEEKQFLLAREVDHRAKNALSLVQAILRLSRSKDVGDYIASVEGRVRALSQAHNLLAQARWQGASLRKILNEELAAYKLDGKVQRVSLEGPDVVLQPAMAQTVALAFHELATNAAKYGSLSVPAGRLLVSWRLEDEELSLEWREVDGPVAGEPTKKGFGTQIIFASVEQQLRGTATLQWLESGLVCSFVVPMPRYSAAPVSEIEISEHLAPRDTPIVSAVSI
ncbi:MAG: response regulator [Pseudolabrys sp.]|nr:response regulator [Pseudolabrys sp.]